MRPATLFMHRRVPAITHRFRSTTISERQEREIEALGQDVARARPFEEIPEAKGLPLIGTLLDYTSFRGYKSDYVYELWRKRHEQLGDIYKERILGESYRVFCRSREDTEKMFRLDDRTPFRPLSEGLSFAKAVAEAPESFANINGEEWLSQRRAVNGPLLMNKTVWKYVKEQQNVAQDFVQFISKKSDGNGEVDDFESALSRWALEMSATFLLNTRMGLLSDDPDPEMLELANGQSVLLEFMADSNYGFKLWKYIKTKQSRELEMAMKRSIAIMDSILLRKRESGELDDSVCGQILGTEDLAWERRISIVYDIMSGSIETTSKAAALFLYCLAREPEVQEKLRCEIQGIPSDVELTGRVVDGLKYMNAFIKEGTRLYPLMHVFARIYLREIVLSGYGIPAGTMVLNTANSTNNTSANYFPEPNKFIPERWMKTGDNVNRFNSTGSFGMGARACPGRRFAMQEIRLLLVEILKAYRVVYLGEPIVSVFRTTGCPSEKTRFQFVPLRDSSK